MVRRKTIKKSHRKIPLNRGAGDGVYKDFTAVLENIYSAFDTLREQQDLLNEKMGRSFAEIGEAIDKLDVRLAALEAKATQLTEDMAHLKQEIRLMRHDLSQKVNREEFEILTERIARLEKELGVR